MFTCNSMRHKIIEKTTNKSYSSQIKSIKRVFVISPHCVQWHFGYNCTGYGDYCCTSCFVCTCNTEVLVWVLTPLLSFQALLSDKVISRRALLSFIALILLANKYVCYMWWISGKLKNIKISFSLIFSFTFKLPEE